MRSRHIERMKRRAQLLDATGTPIQAKPGIPFIQWLPNGESEGRYIDRGAEINHQADLFMARGGRYACVNKLGPNGAFGELTAGFPVKGGAKGEMILVAQEIAPDGPEIGPAVDRLVIASVANMDGRTVTEARLVASPLQIPLSRLNHPRGEILQ